MLFPNIQLLKQLQVVSKKSAQLQKKWLLLTRLLFLATLILAFSKPFIGEESAGKGDRIQVLYIDNSSSMLARSGQETLLQQAKKKAKSLIKESGKETRFLILQNDKMSAMRPINGEAALKEIDEITASSNVVEAGRLLNSLQNAQENEKKEQWSVYVFSDFQKSSFYLDKKPNQLEQTEFYFIPFQIKDLSNLYVDTAWFYNPSLENNQDNQLIVQVKKSGAKPKPVNLTVNIAGQTRAVAKVENFKENIWRDTIDVSLTSGWQQVSLALNDFPLTFDDTFRMALRPISSLSVLVIGTGQPEPHLQAALGSYQGFHMDWKNVADLSGIRDLNKYSLIIIQNLDFIPPASLELLAKELDNGGTVLLFPGQQANKESLNTALKSFGSINLGTLDTSRQQVSGLNENHPVWKDLFERIPKNIQLPVVQRRFPIHADLNANQQTLMSFQDGTAFLAQFTIGKGKLFLTSSPLDIHSSDFALSNFFLPTLYKMAIQSQGDQPAALHIGSESPLWIKSGTNTSRGVWHLKANNFDAVPEQRPSGAGIDIFIGKLSPSPGFYKLQQEGSSDSVLVALNVNRQESDIEYASQSEIENNFQPLKIKWIQQEKTLSGKWQMQNSSFPLWKILIVVALLCLIAETYFLFRKPKIENI